jgi:hypothetical protein
MIKLQECFLTCAREVKVLENSVGKYFRMIGQVVILQIGNMRFLIVLIPFGIKLGT